MMRVLPFLLGDLLWLAAAALTAQLIAGGVLDSNTSSTQGFAAFIPAVFILVTVVALALARAYEPHGFGLPGRELLRSAGAVSFAVMAVWQYAVAVRDIPIAADYSLFLWAGGMAFLFAGRALVRFGLYSRGIGSTRVVLIGDPDSTAPVLQRLRKNGQPFRVAGIVSLSSIGEQPGPASQGGPVRRYGLGALPSVLAEVGPVEIMVATPPRDYAQVARALKTMLPPNSRVHLALDPLIGEPHGTVGDVTHGMAAIRFGGRTYTWEYERIKRAMDVAGAAVGIFLTAPLMALVVIAIRLDSPGPVLFKQTRVGKDGRPFSMYKFRSMKFNAEAMLKDLAQFNEASGAMFKMKDDPRITRVGRIMRKLSLDELPQFFNVLSGSMSLVGPRPPLPHEVRAYQQRHLARLQAVPGITGLWQVSRGREIDFEEMVAYDLEYMRTWSVTRDVVIIMRTFSTVVSSRGAY